MHWYSSLGFPYEERVKCQQTGVGVKCQIQLVLETLAIAMVTSIYWPSRFHGVLPMAVSGPYEDALEIDQSDFGYNAANSFTLRRFHSAS